MSRSDQANIWHYPPPNAPSWSRQASVAVSAGRIWAAWQERRERRAEIAIYRDGERVFAETGGGIPHQPVLVADGKDGIWAFWNEARDDGWAMVAAHAREDKIGVTDLATHDALMLPPAAVMFRGRPWIAWAQRGDDHIRVRLLTRSEDGWEDHGAVSPGGCDACRPALAADDHAVHLAWDMYYRRRDHVGYARWNGARWTQPRSLDAPGQRWFCPQLLADGHGGAWLAWVAMQSVTDDLGIIDHAASARVARIGDDGVPVLITRDGDPTAADLREGLLAQRSYMGYHGLRRRPQLAMLDNSPWLFWEFRGEAGENHLEAGGLYGRPLREDGWGDIRRCHEHGFAYAVTDNAFAGQVFDVTLRDFTHMDWLAPEAPAVPEPDPERWARWQSVDLTPPPSPASPHAEYQLFWADTHVHSRWSPDAEGEADEIIHFARDRAGLDAVCITDNDYYPGKALSEAAWRMQQELATHYTQPGRFVCFAGFEATRHRADLTPDFDHRIVFYPSLRGPLLRRTEDDFDLPDDAISYPHHPTYDYSGREDNVEICSSWRVVFEESDFTLARLRAGQRTGFIGSSDSHRTVPGLGGALTGIYARELTPEALAEAYRARRLIATQGQRIAIDLRVGGLFIGAAGNLTEPPLIQARVLAPAPIERLDILRDGEPIFSAPASATSFRDHDAAAGEHFYFARVKLVGDPAWNTPPEQNSHGPFRVDGDYPHNLARARGPFAWSSPIRVRLG